MYVFLMKKTKSETNEEFPISRARLIHDAIKGIKPLAVDNPAMINKKTSKSDTIIIDPELKRKNGEKITLDDIPDGTHFGNGVTSLGGFHLKDGEQISIIFFVFENNIGINMNQLKQAERTLRL